MYPAHCTTLLIDLPLGKRLQILCTRGAVYVQKWHMRYKTSDISETKQSTAKVITRQRSFAEYWKYFVARFNDVHAFGYNCAGSERIWMKFRELRAYCLVLALTDFERDPHRSESGRPCGIFVFCQVNNARLCQFPVSQFSRNLQTKRFVFCQVNNA